MPTNNLKVLAACVAAAILAAGCAKLDPPELPPPLVSEDGGAGWRNY